MILHCEKCNTRYLLPSHSLAPDGRRVRCTVCDHEWYQDYEESDYVEDTADEEDLDPIPESVKPIPEGSNVPSVEVKDDVERFPVGGVLASVAVFGIIFGALVHFKAPITDFWPRSGAFYAALGMDVPLPSEGLIFDQLKGTSDNGEQGSLLIDLTGNIVNLSSERVKIPSMRFTVSDKDGADADVWYMPPVQEFIEAHGEVPFQTLYETQTDNAQGVNVGFVVGDVPAVADEEELVAAEDEALGGEEAHAEEYGAEEENHEAPDHH